MPNMIPHPLTGFAEAFADLYAQAPPSPKQKALDDRRRLIARLLFECDAIWQGVESPAWWLAPESVKKHYLANADASIALASDAMRTMARAAAQDYTLRDVEAVCEQDGDGVFTEGDKTITKLAAIEAISQFHRQLQRTTQDERGRL